MLPLHDTQVRFVLLGHVTSRLAEARPDELDAVGIANEQLDRLRQLSALDLNRLAAMRTLTIGISLDGEALQVGLRAVALVKEAKALEAHFIQQGASTRLMSALFKVRRKLTLKLRRDLGVCRPSGRVPLDGRHRAPGCTAKPPGHTGCHWRSPRPRPRCRTR